MKIKEVFRPSILISEVFYPYVDRDDDLVRLVEWAARLEYYQGVEIGAVYSTSARKAVRKILNERTMGLTSWATRDLGERNLTPSSLDASVRKRTDDRLRELLDMAAECGADNFCLISGPDPGADKREQAKEVFYETVCRLLEWMKPYRNMNLMIEPLDRSAHKKGLIGPKDEALEFIKKVRAVSDRCYFSWDSAHVALNEENLTDSVRENAPFIGQIHLANAVLDRGSALYGDWHMDVGEPGFLTEAAGYDILNAAAQAELPPSVPHFVSVEVRGNTENDAVLGENKLRSFLAGILEKEIV